LVLNHRRPILFSQASSWMFAEERRAVTVPLFLVSEGTP
jgi:hypothetical protein